MRTPRAACPQSAVHRGGVLFTFVGSLTMVRTVPRGSRKKPLLVRSSVLSMVTSCSERYLANSWPPVGNGEACRKTHSKRLQLKGYRSGALSHAQVQRVLGHDSRWETDPFLTKLESIWTIQKLISNRIWKSSGASAGNHLRCGYLTSELPRSDRSLRLGGAAIYRELTAFETPHKVRLLAGPLDPTLQNLGE